MDNVKFLKSVVNQNDLEIMNVDVNYWTITGQIDLQNVTDEQKAYFTKNSVFDDYITKDTFKNFIGAEFSNYLCDRYADDEDFLDPEIDLTGLNVVE